MNVCRLNFSHGTYEDHAKLIKTIRTAAKESGRTVALLQDLQGPRIRTGELPAEGVTIKKGESVVLLSQKEYNTFEESDCIQPIPIQTPELSEFVKVGGTITIQDGLIELKVRYKEMGLMTCTVVQGGTVKSHKGINTPGATLDIPVITKKDRDDLKFGQEQGVDYIALSFVKDEKNIQQLRKLLPKTSRTKIVAKIERAEAVKNFNTILEAVDAIMVARGDLGVELGPAAVPLLQKEIIEKCVAAGKPVIVATQMLESMVMSPRPTRAEAADVANAIIDHADAIMLSAESATGAYPVQAVQTMTAIARKVEQSKYDDLPRVERAGHRDESRRQAVAHAAVEMAESSSAKAIMIAAQTGNTARYIAQLRPQHTKIVVCSHDDVLLRQLQLVWGVQTVQSRVPVDKKNFARIARRLLQQKKMARIGDTIVLVSGWNADKDATIAETIQI